MTLGQGVKTVFSPSHYERLAALQKKLDPKKLLGSDRNIPPDG